MTMTSFAIAVYCCYCCRRHVVGQQSVSIVRIINFYIVEVF